MEFLKKAATAISDGIEIDCLKDERENLKRKNAKLQDKIDRHAEQMMLKEKLHEYLGEMNRVMMAMVSIEEGSVGLRKILVLPEKHIVDDEKKKKEKKSKGNKGNKGNKGEDKGKKGKGGEKPAPASAAKEGEKDKEEGEEGEGGEGDSSSDEDEEEKVEVQKEVETEKEKEEEEDDSYEGTVLGLQTVLGQVQEDIFTYQKHCNDYRQLVGQMDVAMGRGVDRHRAEIEKNQRRIDKINDRLKVLRGK